ncbi:MAG TPA: AraC family transcriptional regulator [Pedobacter sp.]|jgi:AraC-like DNA-binding protein
MSSKHIKAKHAFLPDLVQAPKSFLLKKIERPHFATDLHFHSECQLVYVLSGSGMRIIGDTPEHFEPGDVSFVGPNIPHVWYSDSKSSEKAISIALYINPVLLCQELQQMMDTEELQQFFTRSERGIRLEGHKKKRVQAIMLSMQTQKSVSLLASFFKILDELLDPDDLVWLNQPNLLSVYSNQPQSRVHKLMNYLQQNFREEITLSQAASVAGLEIRSFCRYFKTLTNRTFSAFVNEMRIGFASKLLVKTDLPVTQVGQESGYSNQSYFNRVFRDIHQMSPKEFRKGNKLNSLIKVPES